MTRSFAAVLDGTMDWRTGATRLAGVVADEWGRGVPVEGTATLDRKLLDGTGSLHVGLVAVR